MTLHHEKLMALKGKSDIGDQINKKIIDIHDARTSATASGLARMNMILFGVMRAAVSDPEFFRKTLAFS